MYKSNEDLYDELSKSKQNLISELSKNKYLKLIKERLKPIWDEVYTLKKFNLHQILLDGPKPFIAFLNCYFDLNLASRIRIAILSLFIHTSLREECELYSIWKRDMNEAFANVNMEHCQDNMPSINDQKSLIIDKSFNTDKKYIDQEFIREIYKNLVDGSDDKLYFAFMGAVGQPPVRSCDCYRTCISTGDSDNPNYIDISNKPYKFILRDYKTFKRYHKKCISLHNEICEQIDISLSQRPREYLFVNPKTEKPFNNRKHFSKYANLILKKHIGNQFSGGGRLLRHTYVSDRDLDFKNMTNKERASIAYVMGNSERTIQFNYLYKDTNNWDNYYENLESSIEKNKVDENICNESNLDLDKIRESKIRLHSITKNIDMLKEDLVLSFNILLVNPLCQKPINIKGDTLPLLSLWKCELASKNDLNTEKKIETFYNTNSKIKGDILYVKDLKYGIREYSLVDCNIKKLIDVKLSSFEEGGDTCIINNFQNSQYYYKIMNDTLRNKDLFPELPDTYTLKQLQDDIIQSNLIKNLDLKEKIDGNRSIKSKKYKRKRKKKTTKK